ncbi:MAG: transporter [Frankiales bacterium]|nr:transporter [Frankiales bacterium]
MPTVLLDSPRTPPATKDTRSHALPVIVLAQLMVVLDATIVNIALPSIQSALSFSRAELSWVINAYALTFGGLLLLGARSGDLFGRRRTFLVGISIFTIASLAGGLATSSTLLLAARAAQGIGAALASPSALALLLVTTREGVERTRALALYSAVSIGGAAIGLVAGGVLVEWASWQWVFYVNVPIGIALLVLARRHLTETPRKRGRIDFAGAITSTIGMAGLVYGFTEAASAGWKATSTLGAFATGIVLLTAFVFIERRVATPITPLRLFASRDRVFSYLARLGLVGGMFGMFFFLTQFMTGVLGYSGIATGLAFLPLSAAVFTTSQLSARFLLPRVGAKRLMVGGISISTTALLLLTQLNATSGYWLVLVSLLLFGIGNGSAFVPLTAAALAGVDPADAGAASGLVNVMQQIGGALGLSILVTVFGADNRAQRLAGVRDDAVVFVHGADRAFLVAAVMLAISLALIASMRSAKRVRSDGEAKRSDDEMELVLAGELVAD